MELPDWFAAAYRGDIDALSAMLMQGADVNAWHVVAAHDGMTALHYAAWNCEAECARFLIASGADVNADYDVRPGWCGWTPLMCAVDSQVGGSGENEAAMSIVRLLLESGADPNVRHVETALELAEMAAQKSIAALLRQAGARE